MKKLKLAQVGSFDVENFGDLLFPVVLENKLNIEQLDLFSPNGGIKPFTNDIYVFPLSELEKKCLEERYDAIIIGGGDLIRSDKIVVRSYETEFITSLSLWQLPILIGHKLNIPVLFNAPGVPLEFSYQERKFVKELLSMVDYISVRDEFSKEKLVQCGVKNVEVVPDTVLSVSKILPLAKCNKIYKELVKQNRFKHKDKYIIFQHNIESINNSSYIESVKEFLDVITKRYDYDVILFPIGYVHNDLDFLTKVYDKDNEKITLITEKFNPEEMLSIFSKSSGYIGTSMHGLVAAYAYSKPVLTINLRKLSKIKGILKNIGCTKLEVKNTSSLLQMFETEFLKYKEQTKIRNSILANIDKHFKKINELIEKQTDKKQRFNIEEKLLNSIYSGFYDEFFVNVEKISLFLNYGNGYSEDDKIVLKSKCVDNNIKFSFPVSSDIKGIRVDLIEGKFIIINSLSIKLNNKKLKYYIPCSFEIDKNKLLINNLDPQIYIDNGLKEGMLEFDVDFEVIDYSYNYNIYEKMNQNRLSLLSKIDDYTDKLESMNNTLLEKDKKIIDINNNLQEVMDEVDRLKKEKEELNKEIEYLNSKLINRIANLFNKGGRG